MLSVGSCDVEQYNFKQSAVIVSTSAQPECNIVQLKQNQQMDNNTLTSSTIKQEHPIVTQEQQFQDIMNSTQQTITSTTTTNTSTTPIINHLQPLCQQQQQLDPLDPTKLESMNMTTEMITNYIIFWIHMIIQLYCNNQSVMNIPMMITKMTEYTQLLLITFIEHIYQMNIQQITMTNYHLSSMIGMACQSLTMNLQTIMQHHIIGQNFQHLKHPLILMNLYTLIFQQWKEFIGQIKHIQSLTYHQKPNPNVNTMSSINNVQTIPTTSIQSQTSTPTPPPIQSQTPTPTPTQTTTNTSSINPQAMIDPLLHYQSLQFLANLFKIPFPQTLIS